MNSSMKRLYGILGEFRPVDSPQAHPPGQAARPRAGPANQKASFSFIFMRRMCRQGQEPAASESDSKPSSSSFVCAGGGEVNRTCQRSREPRDQRARLKLRFERRPYKTACLHQLLTLFLSAAKRRAAGPSRVGPGQAEISRWRR